MPNTDNPTDSLIEAYSSFSTLLNGLLEDDEFMKRNPKESDIIRDVLTREGEKGNQAIMAMELEKAIKEEE